MLKESDDLYTVYWEWHLITRWLLRITFPRFPEQLLKVFGSTWYTPSISSPLSDCSPWCQYSIPVVCLLASYRVPLCIDHKATEMQIEFPADVNNYRPIIIAICQSSLQGTWAGLAVASRQVPVDCRQPILILRSSKQFKFTIIRASLYSCFLDAKKGIW